MLDIHGAALAHRAETGAERSAKAAAAAAKALAKGAKSQEEHRILTALRTAPATSMTDLERRTGLNGTALTLAFNGLRDRGMVRETAGLLGTLKIVAVQLADD